MYVRFAKVAYRCLSWYLKRAWPPEKDQLQTDRSNRGNKFYVAMSIKPLFTLTTACFTLLCFITVQTECLFLVEAEETRVNTRPIIGILTQEISYKLNHEYPNMYHSYIAASYVKFVEGAGARVAPIWIGKEDEYYEDILSKVNGVLFPGGSTWFNQTDGYADAGKAIYRIAERMNRNGDYFPLWGTCLGFELLTYLAANGVEHRDECSSQGQALPLEFTDSLRKSRLFKDAPREMIDILRNENLTINFHQYCVTQDGLARVSLTDKFRIISVNKDWNGLQFISSLEHVTLPFYGVQFHPEKNIYEWVTGKSIPHGFNSTKASQYFADFFVNEARKNNHCFRSIDDENENLIYNYNMNFTALVGSAFQQCYLFKKSQERS